MQAKALAAALALAACFAFSSAQAAAPQTDAPHGKKKQHLEVKKPTWEACYAMSRERGFDHDIEEWLQSIKDCQEGKIPL